jgi:hypothetical protein
VSYTQCTSVCVPRVARKFQFFPCVTQHASIDCCDDIPYPRLQVFISCNLGSINHMLNTTLCMHPSNKISFTIFLVTCNFYLGLILVRLLAHTLHRLVQAVARKVINCAILFACWYRIFVVDIFDERTI